MNQPLPHIDHYLAEFARVERNLAGGDALAKQRHSHLRAFADAGFPTPRQEDWKYTDLRALEKRRFETLETPGEISANDLEELLPDNFDSHRLVFVDGHFNGKLSQVGDLPDGATLTSLAAHLDGSDKPRPNGERSGLAGTINGYANPFTDMNLAFMSDGFHLHLAANIELQKPVHVVFLATGQHEDGMQQLRNVVALDDNSRACLVEQYIGLGDTPYFTNAVTEVDAGTGSALTRIRLQQESEKAYHVSSMHARQRRDSHVINHGIDLGSRLARIDTNSALNEPGATVEFYGVYAPSGKQHVDNHTRIDHATAHGTSREDYKGVLSGRSRGVFNGKIVVHKDAQKTDSEQSSAALLLSKKAEVDAKPELEIYADDVKCEHGSTVGQLDEDAVFYLTSRGINEAGARAILTYSFADELIKTIEPETLRTYIEAAFLAKLPEGENYSGLL